VRDGSGFGLARAHDNCRYLTFDDPNHLSLDTYVFNTEGGRFLLSVFAHRLTICVPAHPFLPVQ
jgi:hypothetical protein